MTAQEWFKKNTFHHSQFSDIDLLIRKKKKLGYKISVGIPTLNEEETIGAEVSTIRYSLMEQHKLIDEIVVIDSGSKDSTRKEAKKAGAEFYYSSDILKEYGNKPGKGENLWKSLWVLKGNIIVWFDADIKNITPKFVYGLIGPLLEENDIGYVKGFYDRPLNIGTELRPSGGGRVTELMVRPLFSLCYPDLAYIMQPLSGEYAGKREYLEKLTFPIGYGVEVSHLLELYQKYGLPVLGQVDLDVRVHRNRSVHELGKMSFEILQAFLKRADEHKKLKIEKELNYNMVQFEAQGDKRTPKMSYYEEIKRPPINTLECYRKNKKDYI